MIDASRLQGAALASLVPGVPYWPGLQQEPGDWRGSLIISKNGTPKGILANAISGLSRSPEWAELLAFDEFSVRIQTQKKTPWGKPAGEPWTDHDDRKTAEWLQRQGVLVPTNIAGEAVQTVAAARRFHPVRDYLRGLVWDRRKRLDTWAARYLGAEADIANKFGRLWLISAVARVMRPGCKADCCLILEGLQGAGKSTALKTMAGSWFTDQLSDLGSKDSALQCHGVWIVELAELDAINRSEASKIKGFMSQTFDRIRLPYGKNVTEWPRDCVFAGTVNHDCYLKDETGARRFWPVRCGQIDIAGLEADRDQLWAEAYAQFVAGAAWWLQDQSAVAEAQAEQLERYQGGAWDSVIAAWAANPQERRDFQGHPVGPFSSDAESVTVADILAHAIGKRLEFWTRGDEMAVSAALRSQGWERFRRRDGNKLDWRYRRSGA